MRFGIHFDSMGNPIRTGDTVEIDATGERKVIERVRETGYSLMLLEGKVPFKGSEVTKIFKKS